MERLTGQSIGRYNILEKLGEGGMATVYKALDTQSGDEVAFKVIRTEKLTQESAKKSLARFEREAKALLQLDHPNIVKVLDYGEIEDIPYIVMPYLNGGTLKKKLKPIPWQEAVRLLVPIIDALAYAHKNGVIHRDIKPSNILLTESGQPMLSDFGVAKILQTEETMDLTGTGVGVGTPEYMAPEQGLGKGVDHRSDIYSLGVVLYEMITGRKPYQADTPMAILHMQLSDPLPPPSQFVKKLPKNVEKVILKALAKDVHSRYQNANSMAEALEGLIREPKVLQKEKQPSRQVSKRFGLVGLVVGVVVLLAGSGILLSQRMVQRPEVTSVPPTQNPIPIAETATEIIPTKTSTPLPRPTNSPTLTLSPDPSLTQTMIPTTLPPITSQPCKEESQFVADVTIPDGTVLNPGEVFTKVWKVQNSGTCTWKNGFSLQLVTGDALGGTAWEINDAIEFVESSESVDIRIEMTAPSTNGEHGGCWRMRDDNGNFFGTFLCVLIDIK